MNIAWRTEDTVLKIANDMANPANVVKLNDGTATINVTPTPVTDNTAQVANDTNFKMQTNISPQVGANSAINDMAVMGGNVLNPAAWLDNMSTNISPQATSRGGVVLASTAGGGWLESLAALLGGRLDGRVS